MVVCGEVEVSSMMSFTLCRWYVGSVPTPAVPALAPAESTDVPVTNFNVVLSSDRCDCVGSEDDSEILGSTYCKTVSPDY